MVGRAADTATPRRVADQDDGLDGLAVDDERPEESDGSSDDEDEPVYRYDRVAGDALDVLSRDRATALAACPKFLVRSQTRFRLSVQIMGTDSGYVFLLSFEGHVLRRFRPHRAAVLAISVDEGCESIGSASIDGASVPVSPAHRSGTVAVASLSTTDVESVDLRRPVRCIALDPEYSRRSNHHFVTGGMAGHLILHERGWLGQKEVLLHSGDSPVWAATWRTNWIAWATDEVR